MKATAISFLLVILTVLSTRAADLPPAEPVTSLSPAYARNREVVASTQRLLKAKDTAGLETLAAKLRESKDALDGGTWMLSHFYSTADDIPDSEPEAGEAMKFFEEWAKNRPQNITAQVCLANALTSYAWKARGSGYSDSVSKDGWKLFEERLERASSVLDASSKLEEHCPGWYEAGQVLGLGQGWGRSDYMDFVKEAIEREPTYGKYFTNTCYWLLPRWHGEEGDFEAWIAEQADAQPPEKKDWHYARLVWMAHQMPVSGELIFAPDRLDWDRTKRGFETWLATMPENLNVRFEFTKLAVMAGDRETARAQFDITGGKYFPRAWKDQDQFDQARKFAYEGGPNPLSQLERAQKASKKITPETIGMVSVVLGLAAAFLGSALVGACLLTLAVQRREDRAGFFALAACLVLGTAFGTLATVLPAALLYFYLQSRKLVHPPELHQPPWGIVLLWVVVLAGSSLPLQMGSGLLAAMPSLLELGSDGGDEPMIRLARDGTMFRLVVAASWIPFLGLLIACGPQNRAGWQRRLGLHAFRIGPAILWTLLAGMVVVGLGYLSEKYMDEYSRLSLKLMAEGIHSPFWFFLAIAVVAPITEELLFRGYAYSGWIAKFGPWGTTGLSALLFTLCHAQYGFVGLLYIFTMGLALGLLRWKTGSVYPCIALHFLNNLANCVITALTVTP